MLPFLLARMIMSALPFQHDQSKIKEYLWVSCSLKSTKSFDVAAAASEMPRAADFAPLEAATSA
jgi:hypothetical protein